MLTPGGGIGCLDGASSNNCNNLHVTDYFVDKNGTIFFTDIFQIRYLSPNDEVYTIYGAPFDDINKVNGHGANQKSGALARLSNQVVYQYLFDLNHQKITFNVYEFYEDPSSTFTYEGL